MPTQAQIQCTLQAVANAEVAATCESYSHLIGVTAGGVVKRFRNRTSHIYRRFHWAQVLANTIALNEYVPTVMKPNDAVYSVTVGSDIAYDPLTGRVTVACEGLYNFSGFIEYTKLALDGRGLDNLAGFCYTIIQKNGAGIMASADASPTVWQDASGGSNVANANIGDWVSGPSTSTYVYLLPTDYVTLVAYHSFAISDIRVMGSVLVGTRVA